MNTLRRCIIFVVLIAIVSIAEANPIPWPLPANMPLEDMYAYLDENGAGDLQETFNGDYYFSYIPEDVNLMKYPVPPKSDGISVAMGRLPEDWIFNPEIFPFLHEMQIYKETMRWYYIRSLYPTVLPEWPGIPMIAWNGPFPQKAVLSVKYQHNLLKRHNDYIYFYALGTGKYFQTYQKEAISFLDISMPIKYNMCRLFLDRTPHAFAVTCEKDELEEERRIVSIYASSHFGPFTKDIIGCIRPRGIGSASYSDTKKDVQDLIPILKLSNENPEVMVKGPPQICLNYKIDQYSISQPPGIKPNVIPLGRRMIVTDQILFNCCSEYVRMTILVDGNRVIFREKAIESAPCDCIRYYSMKGIAGPFEHGTYQVELINPYGRKILEKEIEIGHSISQLEITP